MLEKGLVDISESVLRFVLSIGVRHQISCFQFEYIQLFPFFLFFLSNCFVLEGNAGHSDFLKASADSMGRQFSLNRAQGRFGQYFAMFIICLLVREGCQKNHYICEHAHTGSASQPSHLLGRFPRIYRAFPGGTQNTLVIP